MQQAQSGLIRSRRILLRGRVQGVGFRPFIYRHASAHGLTGWVRNISGRVEIHVQGLECDLDRFADTLLDSAPPVSRPSIESVADAGNVDGDGFHILDSFADADSVIHLPADLYTCPACRDEMNDAGNRRYRYPFINCTQCGPRYTIIEALPYDRVNTSMKGFELCEACANEYGDVSDRRYHAEPVACRRCGPALRFVDDDGAAVSGNEHALAACAEALGRGEIVAIKGIGGYHLACDARNDAAVLRLRDRKPRPHKPLAVMFAESLYDTWLELSDVERECLLSSARPVVLARPRRAGSANGGPGAAISPGLDTVGAMLPYSPLHHLLLQQFGAPLVMTSANISGEPVLTDEAEVTRRLPHVATGFLHHDRPIVRPADDSVYREIAGVARPLRLGRGGAPLELELPFTLPQPLLAVGCHMKNTIALAWDRRAVVSPHIGEMDSLRSMSVFERCIEDLQALYQVEAAAIVCDAHPGYGSTRWAQKQRLPVHRVYHHHAHASAAWFETRSLTGKVGRMLAFTWDGVGLGADGSLWGGEAFLGRPGEWSRVAHLRRFCLPGGERAGREPWRSAAALCWELGIDCPLPQAQPVLLREFWTQRKNAPVTTAAGRLFDAAAALTGVCAEASFEGQGPMWLEAIAEDGGQVIELPLAEQDGVIEADWSPLVPMLLDESLAVSQRAGSFHASLASSLLQQATRIRHNTGVDVVGLAGGVFQNRRLTESALGLLEREGFRVILPAVIPVNDAGISFGQIIEHGYHQQRGQGTGPQD